MEKPMDAGSALRRLQHWTITGSGASGKVKCERDWNWKPRPLPDCDLWYVVSGVGTIRINDRLHDAGSGNCFLLRRGDRIFAEHDPEQRLIVIYHHFRIAPLAGAAPEAAGAQEPFADWPRPAQIRDPVWFEQLLNRLLALDDERDDPAGAVEYDAVMKAVLCIIARDSSGPTVERSPGHAAVRKAIRLIKENVATPLDRRDLAAYTGLSPRYLNILFKSHAGVSLKTYLARARIERACMLLAESTMNVSQIAETMGYADIYFFSKQFKQFVGESPSRYRARAYDARNTQPVSAADYEGKS